MPLDRALEMEPFYELHTRVCDRCFLVQLPVMATRETIFNDGYAYFSSYSRTVLDHSRAYVEQMIDRFGFDSRHTVVEVASNDGYLLQFFRDRGVNVLGVEPSGNVAEAAIAAGIPSRVRFFGAETAAALKAEGFAPDLMLGNNVLAHVPDINDFVEGFRVLLAPQGVVTIEFPHLLQEARADLLRPDLPRALLVPVVPDRRADLRRPRPDALRRRGDPAAGRQSLRIYACHAGDATHPVGPRVAEMRDREIAAGLTPCPATWRSPSRSGAPSATCCAS